MNDFEFENTAENKLEAIDNDIENKKSSCSLILIGFVIIIIGIYFFICKKTSQTN